MRGKEYTPQQIQPWIDFLQYLIPSDEERKVVERWVATLVSRLDTKMHFSLILISDKQGTGKTTLGSEILYPLVGFHNGSVINDSNLQSNFNSWLKFKRLIVAQELSSGKNVRPYHKLKSVIAEPLVTVNEKHVKEFQVENEAVFYASTNNFNALKIQDEERRWYFPRVVEKLWSDKENEEEAQDEHVLNFQNFYNWLHKQNGLAYIRHWCDTYGDYIKEGEKPPKTELKTEIIEDSRTPEENTILSMASLLSVFPQPVIINSEGFKNIVRGILKTNNQLHRYGGLTTSNKKLVMLIRKGSRNRLDILKNEKGKNLRVSISGKTNQVLYVNNKTVELLDSLETKKEKKKLRSELLDNKRLESFLREKLIGESSFDAVSGWENVKEEIVEQSN